MRERIHAEMNQFLDDWNITVLSPNDSVRILCYRMGEEELDTRMIREPTDRTHLAYAMAYQSEFFMTSDRNLTRYRIPSSLEEIGFSKPICMTVEEFRDGMLMKVFDISYGYDTRIRINYYYHYKTRLSLFIIIRLNSGLELK